MLQLKIESVPLEVDLGLEIKFNYRVHVTVLT